MKIYFFCSLCPGNTRNRSDSNGIIIIVITSRTFKFCLYSQSPTLYCLIHLFDAIRLVFSWSSFSSYISSWPLIKCVLPHLVIIIILFFCCCSKVHLYSTQCLTYTLALLSTQDDDEEAGTGLLRYFPSSDGVKEGKEKSSR